MGMARQVWYADDAAGGSSRIGGLGCRHFGYHVNTARTWLVVKEEQFSMVQALRLHLLVDLIWVQLLVPKTTSEITHRITFLNGLRVCLSYPQLLLLNPMGSPQNEILSTN